MQTGKKHVVVFNTLVVCLLVLASTADADCQERKAEWREALYLKNVSYSDYACRKEDAAVVSAFFVSRPPHRLFPICHNDCPIVSCRPVIRFPPAAKAIQVTGTISVHVLVDEKGDVIYARPLDGHVFLRESARVGACETKFKSYNGKHQGVMHFFVENYEFLGVPSVANQVQ